MKLSQLFLCIIVMLFSAVDVLARVSLDSLIQVKNKIAWEEEIDVNKIEFELALSRAYYYAGRLNEAKQAALDAQSFISEHTDELLVAKTHVYLGNMELEQSEFSKALTSFNQAYEIFSKKGSDVKAATVLGNIAVVFERLENFELALEYNHKAIALVKLLNDSIGLSNSFTNIGNIYVEMEEMELALDYYNKAIHIDSNLNNSRRLSADYNNFGVLYAELNNYEIALAYFQKTLNIDRENKDIYGQSVALSNIAENYYYLGLYESAVESSLEAISMARLAGSNEYISSNYELMSRVYSKMGEEKKALAYFKKYQEIAQLLLDEKSDSHKVSDIVHNNKEIQERHSSVKHIAEKEVDSTKKMSFSFFIFALGITIVGLAVFFAYYWKTKKK